MPIAPEVLDVNEQLISQALSGHPLFELHPQTTVNITQQIVFTIQNLVEDTTSKLPSWEMFKYSEPDFEVYLKNMRSALLRQTGLRQGILTYFDRRLELIYDSLSQKKPIEEIIKGAQRDSNIRYARGNARLSKYDLQGLNGLPRGQRISPLLPKYS